MRYTPFGTTRQAKAYLLACVCFLTGCTTSTLDKALAQCAVDGGKSSYVRAEGIEKFSCAR